MTIKFNENTINKINDSLSAKKKANPIDSNVTGIGVNLRDSLSGTSAFLNNWQICEIKDLGRMIEELTMLKEAIEEETGLIIK